MEKKGKEERTEEKPQVICQLISHSKSKEKKKEEKKTTENKKNEEKNVGLGSFREMRPEKKDLKFEHGKAFPG